MRSDVGVIDRLVKYGADAFAQGNDMAHTLATDRSDQLFSKAILPRRGWRCRLVPDANCGQSAFDDGAIDPIPIAAH